MLQLIEISLICTGVHVCFMEGMILYFLRKNIEVLLFLFVAAITPFKWINKASDIMEWTIKPLYDCLPCMASVWTCLILWQIDIKAILIVCGINAIIASILQFFESSKLPESE